MVASHKSTIAEFGISRVSGDDNDGAPGKSCKSWLARNRKCGKNQERDETNDNRNAHLRKGVIAPANRGTVYRDRLQRDPGLVGKTP
ncbi:MAG: hypothetical protein WC342_00195 [Methanoregula sp.]